MKPLMIDWREFLRGESSADDTPDRGFSPNSYGLSLLKARGLMYFSEATTDRGSTTLTGNVVASAYDKNYLGNDSYFLDDGGAFYTLKGSTFTKRQTATADTFVLGTSEMLQFQGNTFATSQTRVMMLTGSDLATIDSSWWTGLTTSYRHPLERVEDKLYIGDVNNIHTWDGTTSTAAAIVLPTDVNITSLRKHPDGKNLIAFCGLTANFSHTSGMGGRMYIIDTNTKQWVREIELDVQVEGSKNVGGIIYTTYGKNIGYFDGNGIKFLKKLNNSGTTYSHNITDYDGILMVRDGMYVLAFGDLGMGRVWWRPYKNDVNSQSINNIIYKGSDVLCVAFSDGAGAGKLVELNMVNAGLYGKFYANRTTMPLTCDLRRLEAMHTQSNAGVTFRFSFYNKDETDTENLIYDSNPTSASGTWLKYRNELDIKADTFQLAVSPSNGAPGWRFFRLLYETIER